MSSDLEDIRSLQAQFQEVQRSANKQKLSERNVIELVSKLVELHLIDVLHTADGKTYITHQQLAKEIKDELIVHGGRLNLVDLQHILNMDFSHIEAKANEMVRHDNQLKLVLGQLIHSSYTQRLTEEINDMLQESGHITVVDLTRTYDLPAEFLREIIKNNIGKRIKGQCDAIDRDVLYTDDFVTRMKAQIRGAFSAMTLPTVIGGIRQQLDCQEHLFHTILEELMSTGRLAGSMTGSRHDKSQFVPEIYSRAQNEWVEAFYRQNGYLEFDAMARLGITDQKDYIKRRFKKESLVFLSSGCVGPAIADQVEYSVEAAISSGGWVDIMTCLPSVLSQKDASDLLSKILKPNTPAFVCGMTIVASDKVLSENTAVFADLMTEHAQKAAKSHPTFLSSEGGPDKSSNVKIAGMDHGSSGRDDKREQRRKKAATAGSTKKEGTQGREVKTKSTKKKGRGRDADVNSDDEEFVGPAPSKGRSQELDFMGIDEIGEVLSKQPNMNDCPPELIQQIAGKLHRPLHRKYQEVAKSIFTEESGSTNKKKSALEVQDKINGLWTNAKLFEKGLKLFEEPVQGQLVKHLLKTVGSDLANGLIVAMAADHLVNVKEVDEGHMTPESRLRLVSLFPKHIQEQLSTFISCLASGSIDNFFSQVEDLCGPQHLGILLKKPDKRKERQLVFNHRQSLVEQLRAESEPAMGLHLCAVLLFQTQTQAMLHVPGRLVPTVLQHIKSSMEEDKMATLTQMQDLVVRHAKLKSDPDTDHQSEIDELSKSMAELLNKVKEIGHTTKKSAAKADAED